VDVVDVVAADGATQFARYAYPPNELGYCGPAGASVLLEHTTSGNAAAEVARRAPEFDGVWAYLEVIGAAAGLEPLHPLVVDAYWLGNELLDSVDPQLLLGTLNHRFRHQAGGVLDRVRVGLDVLAHHDFHVYAVYPWLRLLGKGGDTPRAVLDSCRIRWGRVLAVDGERLTVESRRLECHGTRLFPGDPRPESVRWSAAGMSLHSEPRVGDVVSMHWDWVCERLPPDKAAALAATAARSLQVANALLQGLR
jgi:hypothetical protein